MGWGKGGHQGLTGKSDSKFVCNHDSTGSLVGILGISDTGFSCSTNVSSDLHLIFLIWEMILGPVALPGINDLWSPFMSDCANLGSQLGSHKISNIYVLSVELI
jgi:hypothetical protein